MSWWGRLLKRDEQEANLDKELSFHIEERVVDLRRSGLTEEEARRKVRQEFGGMEQVKEQCRDARGTGWVEDCTRDVRYAWRSLAKTRGFTAAALSVLALGIGANSAIFSVVDAVLLRPLPFRDPSYLVSVWKMQRNEQTGRGLFTFSEMEALMTTGGILESVGGFEPVSMQFVFRGEPEAVMGARVTPDLLRTLGILPILGRAIAPGEENTALISHELWRRQFQSDPSIIGQTIEVQIGGVYGATEAGRASVSVVGVLPSHLRLQPLDQAGLWISARKDTGTPALRTATSFVLARLSPNIKTQAAQDLLNARLGTLGWRTNLVPVTETIVGNIRPVLLMLWGAASLVLCIACANLANLYLVRWSLRAKELVIRAALGATSLRIIRQLLVESVTLAVLGGACGLIFAFFCLRLFDLTNGLAGTVEAHLNAPVLVYSACLSVLTGVIFGLAPVWSVRTMQLQNSLRERERSGGLATQGWLLVTEVALAVTLSVGAGLLIRSLARLGEVDPGFQVENVTTARLSLPDARYKNPQQRANFFREVLERLNNSPGVQGAVAISFMPLSGADAGIAFTIEGQPVPVPSEIPTASFRCVSPDYFRIMGIRMLQGRDFEARDLDHARIIVNESLARRLWPHQSALDQRLRLGGPAGPAIQVVGVAANVKQFGLEAEERPALYLSFLGQPAMTLMVRNQVGVSTIATAVKAVDRNQPIQDLRTIRQALDASIAQPRLRTQLLSVFAFLALTLAAVGIFGVTAYSVAQRTREIGIRIALGATPGSVTGMLVQQGFRQGVAGIALGVAGALALRQVLRRWLFGIDSTDPSTILAAVIVALAVIAVAVYVPARRAAALDPLIALRNE